MPCRDLSILARNTFPSFHCRDSIRGLSFSDIPATWTAGFLPYMADTENNQDLCMRKKHFLYFILVSFPDAGHDVTEVEKGKGKYG